MEPPKMSEFSQIFEFIVITNEHQAKPFMLSLCVILSLFQRSGHSRPTPSVYRVPAVSFDMACHNLVPLNHTASHAAECVSVVLFMGQLRGSTAVSVRLPLRV